MPIDGSLIFEHLIALSKHGATDDGGVTRLSLDDNYFSAIDQLAGWMNAIGLVSTIDPVGNLIGRKPGMNKNLKPILVGSHIDTVINGGRYDGTVGVLGGLEVIRALEEDGRQLNHPIELVVFIEEEGTRWGIPLLGSQVLAGLIRLEEYLDLKDREGITLRHALQGISRTSIPVSAVERYPQGVCSYLEIHIEQGAVLDSLGIPVGVVTGIAGPLFLTLKIKGHADHAGATPMYLRKDALVGAASLVLEAKRNAEKISGACVATVGQLEVKPGAVNVVPGEVLMSFDIRDIQLEKRNQLEDSIRKAIKRITLRNKLEYEIINRSGASPVVINSNMLDIIEKACDKVGTLYHKLPSGAGHDAQAMASITDIGMIFVRSIDGVSHAPSELSTIEDITLGAKVLYETILLLDSLA